MTKEELMTLLDQSQFEKRDGLTIYDYTYPDGCVFRVSVLDDWVILILGKMSTSGVIEAEGALTKVFEGEDRFAACAGYLELV